MGIKNSVFIDNSTPQCDAAFLNSVRSEINNIITNTGQTAATSNLNQLGIASANYAAGGDFYTDSGVLNAYVLSAVGLKSTPQAYFNGMRVRFIVGATNTGASTVNVAGLGVKNIKSYDGTSNPSSGDLVAGHEVQLTYNGTNFVVAGGVPYAAGVIPVGAMMDYAASTAPSGWLLCYGQAVSRVTYATLFGVVGTAFGSGDGSTTFNLPDCRGRTKVGLDNLGGSSANRITDANADSLNNTGFGNETDAGSSPTSGDTTITTSTMPSHSHDTQVNSNGSNTNYPTSGLSYGVAAGGGASLFYTSAFNVTVPFGNANTGSGGSHSHTGGALTMTTGSNAQPSIALGAIIKY